MAPRPTWALVLVATSITGCGSGSAGGTGAPPMLGSPCTVDSDCGPNLLCGKGLQGQGQCVGACSDPYGNSVNGGDPSESACWDGRETPCMFLPTTQTCGCACNAGTFCQPSSDGKTGKCVALLAPGAACTGNDECASGMCFSCLSSDSSCYSPASSGTCSVPLGAPCTYPGTPDCPSCFMAGGQGVWCSNTCSPQTNGGGITTSSCPAGGVCLGSTGATEGYCYEECTMGSTSCTTGTTCTPYAAASGGIGTGYACQ